MANPKKKLKKADWERVESLCKIHCTGEEIASVLKMDYDTFNRNVKEKYGIQTSEYIKKHAAEGNASLRRRQWKSAVEDGNTTMLVWLGKQYLGQTDKQEVRTETISEKVIDDMEKAMLRDE